MSPRARSLTMIVLLSGATAIAACGPFDIRQFEIAPLSDPNEPEFLGNEVGVLLAEKGPPLRQMIAPSGSTIYVYDWPDHFGQMCEYSFYISGDTVVGLSERGTTPACTGTLGDAH